MWMQVCQVKWSNERRENKAAILSFKQIKLDGLSKKLDGPGQ